MVDLVDLACVFKGRRLKKVNFLVLPPKYFPLEPLLLSDKLQRDNLHHIAWWWGLQFGGASYCAHWVIRPGLYLSDFHWGEGGQSFDWL